MLQCFLAVVLLYYAMLDNQHRLVAKAFGTFYDQFMQCELELEQAHPRDPQHCNIVTTRHHKQLNLYWWSYSIWCCLLQWMQISKAPLQSAHLTSPSTNLLISPSSGRTQLEYAIHPSLSYPLSPTNCCCSPLYQPSSPHRSYHPKDCVAIKPRHHPEQVAMQRSWTLLKIPAPHWGILQHSFSRHCSFEYY